MKPIVLLILLFTLWPNRAHADTVSYNALIDTSSLAGSTGSLDFNFEAGPFGAQAATVQILQFGGGVLSGTPMLSGDAGGSLPGNLSLDNGTGFNDYFEEITFGSTLSFNMVLSGPALDVANGNGSGSTFAFSIFSDAAGTMPALTSDVADGYAITVDINSDGSTTFHNYTTSVTPEPSSGMLAITGELFVGFFLYRGVMTARCTKLG